MAGSRIQGLLDRSFSSLTKPEQIDVLRATGRKHEADILAAGGAGRGGGQARETAKKILRGVMRPKVTTVRKGDSFYSIAGRELGNQRFFEQVIAANPGITDLQPGMRLRIPGVDTGVQPIVSFEAARLFGIDVPRGAGGGGGGAVPDPVAEADDLVVPRLTGANNLPDPVVVPRLTGANNLLGPQAAPALSLPPRQDVPTAEALQRLDAQKRAGQRSERFGVSQTAPPMSGPQFNFGDLFSSVGAGAIGQGLEQGLEAGAGALATAGEALGISRQPEGAAPAGPTTGSLDPAVSAAQEQLAEGVEVLSEEGEQVSDPTPVEGDQQGVQDQQLATAIVDFGTSVGTYLESVAAGAADRSLLPPEVDPLAFQLYAESQGMTTAELEGALQYIPSTLGVYQIYNGAVAAQDDNFSRFRAFNNIWDRGVASGANRFLREVNVSEPDFSNAFQPINRRSRVTSFGFPSSGNGRSFAAASSLPGLHNERTDFG